MQQSEKITVNQLFKQITTLPNSGLGQNRLVYSSDWLQGQKLLIQFALKAGFQVTVDDYGNTYLDLLGNDQEQVIATGSHMDTVKNGGRFDGLYGVLGGLQAALNLRERFGISQKTIRVISFCEEEGSRFDATFSGSKHYARVAETNGLVDENGIKIENARSNAVNQLKQISGVNYDLPQLPQSFTELHVEQGNRLARNNISLGLVTAIVGQRRYRITVNGITNHAGTTLMTERHDALQATIKLINQFEVFASAVDPLLTFTVGELAVWPNTSNVIPGKVTFFIDCRHQNNELLDEFEKMMKNTIANLPDPLINVEFKRWVHDQPVILSSEMLAKNEKLAHKMGYSIMKLASGAGHDSEIMNRVVPTTMIFVPSINGVSHAPEENTKPEDLQRGVEFLTASLYQEAY
ncbi:M20 family metallo-hydrolase [Lactobacillus sp. ESL0731]|uniref:M20 family metallo-hydrolase n=1 Tax=unclassified Lactobacillus TaxID=2620435 RepID=UPI0023F61C5C|nr:MULTISPECIES: M20 family metallo-hydrolase [unclassified Lactobacillus]WEV51217.1 M20 family metallo-hydrolase [Lactobacillus sp. ESL0700]WEV62347.1 M20 family metallo-hydrolase [Lactobacillus sp. ESL0731]